MISKKCKDCPFREITAGGSSVCHGTGCSERKKPAASGKEKKK